jgi:hypothetical protein
MRFYSLLFDPTAIAGFEKRSHFLTELKAFREHEQRVGLFVVGAMCVPPGGKKTT